MLHIEVPKVPVPAALERAVKSGRDARDAADLIGRDAAQKKYDEACAAVVAHVEKVGVTKMAIPKEVEAKGSAVVEAFVREAVSPKAAAPAEETK